LILNGLSLFLLMRRGRKVYKCDIIFFTFW
jgi:hypothetical protein